MIFWTQRCFDLVIDNRYPCITYLHNLIVSGRIDRKIEFPNPSESARLDILKIHSRKMNLTRGIDLKKVTDM